ncbi:non-canonical purine NTP pyrophosphatase [Veillonella sp. ZSJB6]|uniref:non-canonical purine NTP pyrophosphatase n=1 Tax=Veillonella sp. ZSJB6 TaxID=3451359 RepID=UPI003EE6DF9F
MFQPDGFSLTYPYITCIIELLLTNCRRSLTKRFTYAELSSDVKNSISHRSKALALLKAHLQKQK